MVFQGRNDELLTLLTGQMERYAERLDFEAAAGVRDQLQGLESLSAEQKMSLGDSSISRDVLALAADRRVAAVQLFQMRAGKLVGRLGFTADAVQLSPAEAHGSQALPGLARPGDASPQAPAPDSFQPEQSQPFGIQTEADQPKQPAQPDQTEPEEAGPDRAGPAGPSGEPQADGANLGLILQRVIEEHYSQVDPVEIPPELLLQYPLPQQQLIDQPICSLRLVADQPRLDRRLKTFGVGKTAHGQGGRCQPDQLEQARGGEGRNSRREGVHGFLGSCWQCGPWT